MSNSRVCPRGWLSSEPALRACSKAGSHWLHIKMFPVCVGELWNRSPRKTLEFPCWQTFRFWLEKVQSTWPLAVQGVQLQQEIRPETSRHPFHLRLREKCTQCGEIFAPLVMMGDLKHCLQGSLSPGDTAALKSRFHFVPTKAGNFLPLQTADLYLPNLGNMVVLRAAFCCSRQSQPLTGKVANSLMMRQSQAAREDWVSELKFPWTCKNKPFPWWPFPVVLLLLVLDAVQSGFKLRADWMLAWSQIQHCSIHSSLV